MPDEAVPVLFRHLFYSIGKSHLAHEMDKILKD